MTSEHGAWDLLGSVLQAPIAERLQSVSDAAALWLIHEAAMTEISIGFVEDRRRYVFKVVEDGLERRLDDPDARHPELFSDVVVSEAGTVSDFAVDGFRASEVMQCFECDGHLATLRRTAYTDLAVWPPSKLEPVGWRSRRRREFVHGRIGVDVGAVGFPITFPRSFCTGPYLAGIFVFGLGSDVDEQVRAAGGFVLRHGDRSWSFTSTEWTPEWCRGWPERPITPRRVVHRKKIEAVLAEYADAMAVIGEPAREAIIRQIDEHLPHLADDVDVLATTAMILAANDLAPDDR